LHAVDERYADLAYARDLAYECELFAVLWGLHYALPELSPGERTPVEVAHQFVWIFASANGVFLLGSRCHLTHQIVSKANEFLLRGPISLAA
jgi:hypothetical protein